MAYQDGRDVWPGYFASPVDYYRARRQRIGRKNRWLDDPIKGMYVTVANWAEEIPSPPKGTKRRYRRWRLHGLLMADRALTPQEEFELEELIPAVRADRQRKRKKKSRTTPSKTKSTTKRKK